MSDWKCETCQYYHRMWWDYPCKVCDSPEYSGYKPAKEDQDDEPKDRSNA